jgi:hypothetical protein
MSRSRHTKTFALLPCLALLFAAVGCNEGSMVTPVDVPGGVGIESDFYGILSTPDDPALLDAGKVYGSTVSASVGGTVSNSRVTLEFPAGALDEDTYITMKMVDKDNLVVEFGPHGLVFNKPVTITWKLVGTAKEDRADGTVIKWRNPETGLLEDITNLPVDHRNRVRGLLEHFSEYEAVNG